MNAPFYDIAKTYEENFKNGPPLSLNKLKPRKRNLQSYSSSEHSESRSLSINSSRRARTVAKYKFLGYNVNTPFGIPAGPLLNSQYIKAAFEFGFDVVCYKTQRSVKLAANEYPNILFVDVDGDLTLEKAEKPLVGSLTTSKPPTQFSITNSFGNPSYGPPVWQEDMKKALSYEGESQLLIASVCGTIQKDFSEEDYYDDFAKAALLAKETGVKAIELNLSCPNVANEGVICYTPEAVEYICRKSKEKIGTTPLIAKMGYFSPNQQELLESIVASITPFVEAISVINTIAAPVVDEKGNQALPGPNRLKSGICGASIKWAGLDMVKRLSKLREKLKKDFEIIGVGGVMTPEDYKEYRNAGADVVMSATGAMWNPYLAYDVWKNYEH